MEYINERVLGHLNINGRIKTFYNNYMQYVYFCPYQGNAVVRRLYKVDAVYYKFRYKNDLYYVTKKQLHF